MIIKSAFNCLAHAFLTGQYCFQEVRIVSCGGKNSLFFMHKIHIYVCIFFYINSYIVYPWYWNVMDGAIRKNMSKKSMILGDDNEIRKLWNPDPALFKVNRVLIFTISFDRTAKSHDMSMADPAWNPMLSLHLCSSVFTWLGLLWRNNIFLVTFPFKTGS